MYFLCIPLMEMNFMSCWSNALTVLFSGRDFSFLFLPFWLNCQASRDQNYLTFPLLELTKQNSCIDVLWKKWLLGNDISLVISCEILEKKKNNFSWGHAELSITNNRHLLLTHSLRLSCYLWQSSRPYNLIEIQKIAWKGN